MKKYEKGLLKFIIIASICYLISCVLGVMSAFLLGRALDGAVSSDIRKLVSFSGMAVLAIALGFLINVFASRSSSLGANRISHKAGMLLVHSFYSRTLNAFRKCDDAYYINLLTSDVESLRTNRYLTVTYEVGYAAETISALCLLFIINPIMCLISLIMTFLPMGTSRLFTKIIRKRMLLRSQATEAFTGSIT